jgi:hypothetical protein
MEEPQGLSEPWSAKRRGVMAPIEEFRTWRREPYAGPRPMQGVAMADGNYTPDPAVIGVGSALGTAFLAWLGNRLVGKAAIQTAINSSFKELMDQLRQELKETAAERDAARADNLHLQAEIRQKDAIISGFERTTVAPHGRPEE